MNLCTYYGLSGGCYAQKACGSVLFKQIFGENVNREAGPSALVEFAETMLAEIKRELANA